MGSPIGFYSFSYFIHICMEVLRNKFYSLVLIICWFTCVFFIYDKYFNPWRPIIFTFLPILITVYEIAFQ